MHSVGAPWPSSVLTLFRPAELEVQPGIALTRRARRQRASQPPGHCPVGPGSSVKHRCWASVQLTVPPASGRQGSAPSSTCLGTRLPAADAPGGTYAWRTHARKVAESVTGQSSSEVSTLPGRSWAASGDTDAMLSTTAPVPLSQPTASRTGRACARKLGQSAKNRQSCRLACSRWQKLSNAGACPYFATFLAFCDCSILF